MEEVDWTGVIFGMGVLVLATTLIVVVLTQLGAFSRARILRRDEEHYRELAEKYQAIAAEATNVQEATAKELAEIRDRLDAMEQLLREVE